VLLRYSKPIESEAMSVNREGRTCPSAPPTPGATLLAVVSEGQAAAYFDPAVPMTEGSLRALVS